jgi:DNA-directed RNA polymerase III subunit RPC8
MFYLATIADTIRVPPSQFAHGDAKSLTDAISRKFPGRTIMDVGMVISLFDVLTVGSALIHAGDGSAHFEIVFRVVVFKPFVGEIIEGKVTECSSEGIRISLEFFDNIVVPYYNIFEPNHYDSKKRRWVWDDHKNGDEEEEEVSPNL